MERVTGIEPAWPAWKAGALPLSYTRKGSATRPSGELSQIAESGRQDSNLRSSAPKADALATTLRPAPSSPRSENQGVSCLSSVGAGVQLGQFSQLVTTSGAPRDLAATLANRRIAGASREPFTG